MTLDPLLELDGNWHDGTIAHFGPPHGSALGHNWPPVCQTTLDKPPHILVNYRKCGNYVLVRRVDGFYGPVVTTLCKLNEPEEMKKVQLD